jgi:hypothetical protein
MQMHLKGALAGAAMAVVFLAACSDSGTAPSPVSRTLNQPSLVIAPNATALPEPTADEGLVVVCKAGNASGSFTIGRTDFGSTINDMIASPVTINNGFCTLVAKDSTPINLQGSLFSVSEAPAANTVQTLTRCRFKSADAGAETDCLATINTGSISTNLYHGWVLTYTNIFTPPRGDEGCTPGYWKQDQHFDSWTAPYDPTDSFNTTFGIGTNWFANTFTLLQGLEANGGGANALARHAVAALLNAAAGFYPMTVAEVIAAVQAAYADPSTIESTKNTLAANNELGCPLN